MEELGHIAEVLTEVNIQTDKKQDHSLSISDSKLSSKNNVAFFRSVINDLQLGGFFME